MDVFQQERYGLFDGLRVPNSLNAVLLSAVAMLVYVGGIWGLESLGEVPGTHMCRLLGGMLGNLTASMGGPGELLAYLGGWENTATSYPLLVWTLFVLWTALVWSLFVGAIQRIAAVKLAREEVISLKEAVWFGLRKTPANLLSLLVVAVIFMLFYGLTNATIAGWIARIPFGIGDVLLGVLFFLVQIATFFALFAATLGLLGLNLVSAAIAAEDSDQFDGIARAWNYLLTCPWQVIITYTASTVFVLFILVIGQCFLRMSVSSLSIGWWGLGEAGTAVEVDEALSEALDQPKLAGLPVVYLPGREEYLHGRLFEGKYRPNEQGEVKIKQGVELALEWYRKDVGHYPETLEHLLTPPEGPMAARWKGPYLLTDGVPLDAYGDPVGYRYPSETDGHDGYDLFEEKSGTMGLERVALGQSRHALDVAPAIPGSLKFAYRGVSLWTNVARVLIMAYALAYFLASQTLIYFLLRREVEGDDYTEIVLDEPDDLDDPLAAAQPKAPEPKAEAPEPKAEAPAPKAEAPAPKPAAEPTPTPDPTPPAADEAPKSDPAAPEAKADDGDDQKDDQKDD